jgi:hypothetical protein
MIVYLGIYDCNFVLRGSYYVPMEYVIISTDGVLRTYCTENHYMITT